MLILALYLRKNNAPPPPTPEIARSEFPSPRGFTLPCVKKRFSNLFLLNYLVIKQNNIFGTYRIVEMDLNTWDSSWTGKPNINVSSVESLFP